MKFVHAMPPPPATCALTRRNNNFKSMYALHYYRDAAVAAVAHIV